MILNDPFFLAICFFSIGFLSLIGFTSVYLNLFFKSNIYKYYSYYVLSLFLFVIVVYVKNTGNFPLKSERRNIMQLVVDGLQIISALLFCTFIYHGMILQDIKYTKLKKYYVFFIGFTVFYFAVLFIFPNFVLKNYPFFIVSRVVIYLISITFYYNISKRLDIVYFRYLFFAITFLFVSGFMALWDSTVNSETSIYTGFHYLCIGYFLENSCFMGAFIYKYFNVEKEKKDIEFQHKLQLFTSKIEMQQQTMQDIGREIHDNIGQKLTLASLHIQQLTYENKVPQINTNMESISTTINKSLAELRELSKSLTNDMIDINSISKLLEEECIKINNLKICAAHFKFETDKRMLSYQVKSVLLRISQEFIQNSIKHSDCKNISISLLINNNLIVLNLEDDGKGFDIHKNLGTGIGLNNMKKRTEIIGGNYDLQSNLNGTKLVVEIPSK